MTRHDWLKLTSGQLSPQTDSTLASDSECSLSTSYFASEDLDLRERRLSYRHWLCRILPERFQRKVGWIPGHEAGPDQQTPVFESTSNASTATRRAPTSLPTASRPDSKIATLSAKDTVASFNGVLQTVVSPTQRIAFRLQRAMPPSTNYQQQRIPTRHPLSIPLVSRQFLNTLRHPLSLLSHHSSVHSTLNQTTISCA